MRRLGLLAGLMILVGMAIQVAPSIGLASPPAEGTPGPTATTGQQQNSPQLDSALQAIAATGEPELTQLSDAIRSQGAALVFDDEVTLSPICSLNGGFAEYVPPQFTGQCGLQARPYIVVSNSLRSYPDGGATPPKTLAALLTLQGYLLREDLVLKSPPRDSLSCLAHAFHAVSSATFYWDITWPASQYPDGMPDPQSDAEKSLNTVLQAFRSNDPERVGGVIATLLDSGYVAEDAPCRPAGPSATPGTAPSASAFPDRPMAVGLPGGNGSDTASTPGGNNPWRIDRDGANTPVKKLSGFLDSILRQMGDNLRGVFRRGLP